MGKNLIRVSIAADHWQGSMNEESEMLYEIYRSLFLNPTFGKAAHRMQQLVKCYFSQERFENPEQALQDFKKIPVGITRWHLEQNDRVLAESLGLKDILLNILNREHPEIKDYEVFRPEELSDIYAFIKKATIQDCNAQAANNRGIHRRRRRSILLPRFDI